MKIKVVEIDNYGRIETVRIEPGEVNLFKISGRNRQGKTSVMKAIEVAIGGAKYAIDEPIRQGEDNASIRIEMDDDSNLVVKRRFLASGNTTLELTSKDGLLKKPQQILDELIGTRFLDPIKFMSLTAKEQRNMLLRCVKLDIDLDAHDADRALAFSNRQTFNRELKRCEANLKSNPAPVDDIPGKVDQAALIEEMNQIRDRMDERESARRELLDMRRSVKDQKAAIAEAEDAQAECEAGRPQLLTLHERELNEMLDRHKRELATVDKTILDGRANIKQLGIDLKTFVAANKPFAVKVKDLESQDMDSELNKVKEQLAAADTINEIRTELLSQLTVYNDAKKALKAAKADAKKANEVLVEMDATKKAALAKADMPIENLDVTADSLLFNGLPLSQASGAEQLRVSIAIAAALNPKLRDIWITDGSCLDAESVELVRSFAESSDLRVWLERVGEESDSVIIEEGKVKE